MAEQRTRARPRIGTVAVLRRPLRSADLVPVRDALEAHGVRVDPDVGLEDADMVLVLENGRWFGDTLRRLGARPREARPLVALWQNEPLPLPAGAGFPRQRLSRRELAKIVLRDARITDPRSNARFLADLRLHGVPDLLVVTSHGSAEYLAEQGVAAEVVPCGHHPSLGRDLGLERDIDVLFLGALEVPRRKRLLRTLERRGLRVEAVGGWHDPRFWDEARTRLLNRVKILLNLSRFPGQFSGLRLLLGMASGALVVSEPIYRPEPFRPREHYVSAEAGELVGVVEHYLAAESERLRIAAAGQEFVTRELTMERSLGHILALAEQRCR